MDRPATGFLDFLHLHKEKTFRPKKRFPIGTLRYNLHKHAQATLSSGLDLRSAVRLPPEETFEDWLAVHTVDFFNRINLLYGTISDVCTRESCPTMSGGAKYEYLWQDGQNYKKPTRLPAPQYMSLLMDWIEARINNEEVFPSNPTVPFPSDFRSICSKILSRLFRVFVHIYIHHFDRLCQIGAEPHANTLYKHFYYFVTEHNMISRKELNALVCIYGQLERSNRKANWRTDQEMKNTVERGQGTHDESRDQQASYEYNSKILSHFRFHKHDIENLNSLETLLQ